MDRVLDRLWIASAPSIGAPLYQLGFVALVDLRDRDDHRGGDQKEGHIEIHKLGNRDGDPWVSAALEEVYGFIHKHIRKGRVLVACGAGMSRSAAMVIGYLVRVGFDPVSAFALVRRVRPKIAPLPNMLQAALDVALGHVPDNTIFNGTKLAPPPPPPSVKDKEKTQVDHGKEY